MFGTLGGPEVILILVVALIVFGPRRLPEIGKSMGKMLAEFRKASNDFKRTIEDELEAEKARENAPPVTPPAVMSPTPAPLVDAPPASLVDAPPAPLVEAPPALPRAETVPASAEPPPGAAAATVEPRLAPPEEAVVNRGPAADPK
jgi:TatA/E family protein of Tat protein translocase